MKRSLSIFVALGSLLACLLPAAAAAQPPSDADRVTARALAHEGYEAQKRGQYADAADRFQRAEALVHAPTLEVGLGKLVEAHETYQRIVRETLAPNAPAPFARAIEDARAELAALEPRLAWVTLEVRGPSSPDVRIDGTPVPVAVLGVKRACNPGEHRVQASAAGYAPASRTFSVTEGENATIALPLAPLPAPPPEPVAESRPADGTPTARETSSTPFGRTAGIAALGVGAAGLVVGGVTGVLALTKHASLSGGCPDGHCPASRSSDVSLYNTYATVSTAAFAVGAVGAVAGVTLLLTTPKQAPVTAYAGFLHAGIAGSF
jgi:hypothetical protein